MPLHILLWKWNLTIVIYHVTCPQIMAQYTSIQIHATSIHDHLASCICFQVGQNHLFTGGVINTNINKCYSILRLCQFRILEGSPRTKDQNSVCALVVLVVHSSCERQSPQSGKVVEMNIFYNPINTLYIIWPINFEFNST